MSKLTETYKHIADILSFTSSDIELEKVLSQSDFNWDSIVIEGSKHLVLPSLYCRLKTKKLLHTLPKDLVDYLSEITSINRHRNRRLLTQIQHISSLLNSHNINHTFLKGSAILIMEYYSDIGERMVGDIDILISKNEIDNAFKLLQLNDYSKTYGYAYKTKNFRHKDRLISESELGSIELHESLLNARYNKLLNPSEILSSKISVNQLYIPNISHTIIHLILSWQINDKGYFYNSINFKTAYDIISITKRSEKIDISNFGKIKQVNLFIVMVKLYFPDFSFYISKYNVKLRILGHKYAIKYVIFRKIERKIKSIIIYITKRLFLVFTNSDYIKHLLKKIFR